MNEDKISKLYLVYVELLGDEDLDEWTFKEMALEDKPELKLDILAWTKSDL